MALASAFPRGGEAVVIHQARERTGGDGAQGEPVFHRDLAFVRGPARVLDDRATFNEDIVPAYLVPYLERDQEWLYTVDVRFRLGPVLLHDNDSAQTVRYVGSDPAYALPDIAADPPNDRARDSAYRAACARLATFPLGDDSRPCPPHSAAPARSGTSRSAWARLPSPGASSRRPSPPPDRAHSVSPTDSGLGILYTRPAGDRGGLAAPCPGPRRGGDPPAARCCSG